MRRASLVLSLVRLGADTTEARREVLAEKFEATNFACMHVTQPKLLATDANISSKDDGLRSLHYDAHTWLSCSAANSQSHTSC